LADELAAKAGARRLQRAPAWVRSKEPEPKNCGQVSLLASRAARP
jgi:hypothetical protein